MIYARKDPEKYNTAGMVYVAEVDSLGRRTAGPEWRHVYQTPRWKEYIYGLTDHKWKVYTYDVEEGPNSKEVTKAASASETKAESNTWPLWT